MNKVELFLRDLRDSADIINDIFTHGSCFRLCLILRHVFPAAVFYWSGDDNHSITKINDVYYDIGGKISEDYVKDNSYAEIPKNLERGYSLLKYSDGKNGSVTIAKYKD